MNAAVLSLHMMLGVGFPVRLTPHFSVTESLTPAANCTSVESILGPTGEGEKDKRREEESEGGRNKGREGGNGMRNTPTEFFNEVHTIIGFNDMQKANEVKEYCFAPPCMINCRYMGHTHTHTHKMFLQRTSRSRRPVSPPIITVD